MTCTVLFSATFACSGLTRSNLRCYTRISWQKILVMWYASQRTTKHLLPSLLSLCPAMGPTFLQRQMAVHFTPLRLDHAGPVAMRNFSIHIWVKVSVAIGQWIMFPTCVTANGLFGWLIAMQSSLSCHTMVPIKPSFACKCASWVGRWYCSPYQWSFDRCRLLVSTWVRFMLWPIFPSIFTPCFGVAPHALTANWPPHEVHKHAVQLWSAYPGRARANKNQHRWDSGCGGGCHQHRLND